MAPCPSSGSSTDRIAAAMKAFHAMTKAEKIDLMVKAEVLTTAKADIAKANAERRGMA